MEQQGIETPKPRVLIVTTNPPLDTSGGSLLFYRQFILRKDYTAAVMTDNGLGKLDSIPWIKVEHPAWMQRLARTRLSLWVHDWIHLYAGRFVRREWVQFARDFKPDVIVGGAETWMMDLALSLGRQLNVPVAGFFMDWPTYASLGHDWCMNRLGEHFRKRYRASDAAFSISPEMREVLGEHPNSHLYYPSGEWSKSAPREPERAGDAPFTLLFAGNLGQWYGQAVDSLIRVLQDHPGLQFRVAGNNVPWNPAREQALRENGVFLGFLKNGEYRQALAEADALLVVMGFDEESRLIESTSFKSKMVDYLLQQKPLIIWGPEYCTAVRHARREEFGEVVTDPDPRAVVAVLESLKADPDRQARLVGNGERFFRENLESGRVFGHVRRVIGELIAS